ncbi:MAG: hypothetical protein HKN23_18045 [Verrucomicrobiales bacterium]|nr:hypothetical protein [Verrucomicrobiales bacterium]
MSDSAQTVSLHPYFKANEGKVDEFKALLPRFVELTSNEEACLFYDFTINDDVIFCREAYVGAEGVLAHLDNVGPLLEQALGISELFRVEVHGAQSELDKLQDALGPLNPDWFVFQCGVQK